MRLKDTVPRRRSSSSVSPLDSSTDRKKHHCEVCIRISGTKTDLRTDRETLERLAKKKERPITYDEGCRVARQLKAAKYVECSALNQQGLKDVFDEAIVTVLNKPKKAKRFSTRCMIL